MAAPRRLAAIMFTDLVGFTPRTHRDEPRSMRLLAEHRRLVRAAVSRFGGREVKTIGDGFLIEFDSALNAVRCALELQRHSAEWAMESAEDRPLTRIAVHLGDVIEDGGDILGDAVNVASRLESLAPPGGVCISGPVYEQVRDKVSARFERVEDPHLRGVDSPIDVYRVLASPPGAGGPPRSPPPARVAVLPFASISPDPRDEYLADGLTEELISTLSQIGGLRVIARTSVEVYKRHPKSVAEVGAELDVRSLLEGSVRRAGNKVRVTAQLIDTASQEHLLADTFDRDLDDVFAIQGEIAHRVAERLRVTILDREERRLRSRPTGVTESYLAYLRGRTLLQGISLETVAQAGQQFERAIGLDPNNARAYSGLADAKYLENALSDHSHRQGDERYEAARELASRSILLDPNAAEAHASLGVLLDEMYEFAGADRELRAAISLNPSYARARTWYARLLLERGQLEEAAEELHLAEEADPLSPGVQYYLTLVLLALGKPGEAARTLERLSGLEPEGVRHHLCRFERALGSGDLSGLKQEADWVLGHPPVQGRELLHALWKGKYLAAIGDADGARGEIRRLLGIPDPETGGESFLVSASVAEIYAQLGEHDACFAALQRACATHSVAFEHWWLSSGLRTAREDRRFGELLKRVSLA